MALLAIVVILLFAPMFVALGCPGGCSGDPLFLRAAAIVAGAFLALAAIVLALMALARRTRVAALGLAVVGAVLLSPSVLAVGDAVRGEGGWAWLAAVWLGVGVPGVALVRAAWLVWTGPREIAAYVRDTD